MLPGYHLWDPFYFSTRTLPLGDLLQSPAYLAYFCSTDPLAEHMACSDTSPK